MEYSIADFLRLLGSLGLFLYGMKIMSDALMSLAGERMRSILARMTSNRFRAVLVGFGITAVIQSSSATTLMIVGFANANLLSLSEAIAVIMGTNIGTTVTAWLIAILGFKVNIAELALPFIGIGFVLILKKEESVKNWGYFIIGFALLFIGLEYLKGAVPDLKSNPEVLSFLQAYTSLGYLSLLLFLLLGTILTVIVQSSSATMAITIVMCVEGWIPFDMAAAMVLGFNIGTTITANIGAFVANYHAKRAARAHLIFNVIGVSLGFIFFYPFIEMVDAIVVIFEGESAFAQILVIPIALSVFHTIFNILNTALLINAIGLISRIVIRITPEVIEKRVSIERPHYLSPQAAKYPITALKALLDESLRLFENTAYKVITHGLHIHRSTFEHEPKIKRMLASIERVELNVDDVYYQKVKTIYSEIVEFATKMQSQFNLDEDTIRRVRDILRADRLIADMIKHIKPLHENMYVYLNSDNPVIRDEYNRLRKLILKVLRLSRKIMLAGKFNKKNKTRLASLNDAIESYDVLLNGTIETLIREQKITNTMATSLMNDSAIAMNVASDLVAASSILYEHKDKLFDKLEEETDLEVTAEAAN